MDFDNIPSELKKIDNWVLWKLENRKGKTTKVPYQLNNKMASSNNPETWTTYNKAVDFYNHSEDCSGIGFMFSGSGITGIDIDHCVDENGKINDAAGNIIKLFNSYTEKSQSGTGIHILVKGSIPKAVKKDIEMYNQGRYFALTGDKIYGDIIEERQQQLDALYKRYEKVQEQTTARSKPKINNFKSTNDILEKAFNSKEGSKIKALYNGQWEETGYSSQSQADQALCNYLAFWLNRDFDEIDQAFKQSGLYRPKWDRPDYKSATINKAINDCNKSYQELIEERKQQNSIPMLDFPYKNKKEQPLKVWENLNYLLKIKNIKIKYNLLSREIEVPGTNKSLDELLVEFNTLALTNGFKIGIDDLARFVVKIAKENSYNPVIDYLKKCKASWDGVSRINDLCETIQCYGDNNFKNLLITKWLINAVHIIINKGRNNCEGVLVIQGKQGIGKTRWIRSIIPNPDWLKTGVAVDPSDRDSVSKATKYWIVELGEMEATLKKDQAELKQFFTENSDEYREPYGRFPIKYPRLTCFYATVNDLEFLKDITGNRRYWAIEAKSINVNHNIDLDQLWGEVAALYAKGKIKNYLTQKEEEILNENNTKFEVKSSAEIKLLDNFDWSNTDIRKWSYLTSTEICDYIDENNPVLVGKALRKMMLNNDMIKFNTNGRKYLLPPKVIQKNIYDNTYASASNFR
jgi:hypothetical protein